MKARFALKMILSLGVSAGLIALLFSLATQAGEGIQMAQIQRVLQRILGGWVVVYTVCQLIQTGLRAWRSQILLRAGMSQGSSDAVPDFMSLFWAMLVRGACADLVPARIGELSFVALLNRGCQVAVSDGLSTLSIGLLFDFMALLVVLAAAIGTVANGLSLAGSALLLLIVCVVGCVGIFLIFPWLVRKLSTWRLRPWMERRPIAWVRRTAREMAQAVEWVRERGVWPEVLGISAAIRVVKYAGLYGLFVAVTQATWPTLAAARIPAVLVALISAEGAASLPVPSFMSFGSYEAGGAFALTQLGFGLAEGTTAMLAMHLVSQLIDYGMGGLAFLVFLWRRKRGGVLLFAGGVVALLTGILVGLNRIDPPDATQTSGIGQAVVPDGPDVKQSDFKGLIVWSSNRAGTHDLYAMCCPEGIVKRLTNSQFTDTYPRISSDGQKILFSRSREPYVSQRDPLSWNTWIYDCARGTEMCIATGAYQAAWAPDGRTVVYVRGGNSILQQRPEWGAETTVLFCAGEGSVPSGVIFQTPQLGGEKGDTLVVTQRHRAEGTWIYAPGEAAKRNSGGCQLGWIDGTTRLVWVDHGGKLRNQLLWREYPNAIEATRLLDVEGLYSHEYFPRVSSDGRWLIFGASQGDHEHDLADYEIFVWPFGGSQNDLYRVTWHTGNDCWPDIWLGNRSVNEGD